MEASEPDPLPGKCRDWRALRGPGIIVVDGWCTFPTSGWDMELRKVEPDGGPSENLVLERVVTWPQGPQPPVIKGIEVHWEEVTDFEYATVTIAPDGPTIDVVKAY